MAEEQAAAGRPSRRRPEEVDEDDDDADLAEENENNERDEQVGEDEDEEKDSERNEYPNPTIVPDTRRMRKREGRRARTTGGEGGGWGWGRVAMGYVLAGPLYLFKCYSRFAASFLPKELLHGAAPRGHQRAVMADYRRRARLFANLTVGLMLSAILLILMLIRGGNAITFECLSLMLSLTFYVSILIYLRISKNLVWATYALLAYMNGTIMLRCYISGLGLRSFTADWSFIPPVFAFFMLGSEGGGLATAVILLETLFLYFYGESGTMGVYYSTDCVTFDQAKGTVFVPSSCHIYSSPAMLPNHIAAGPSGVLVSKLLALSFLSGLAYIYETNRSRALRKVRQALAAKDRTNQSLREATEAKTTFLSNMSHELRTPMHGIIAMVKDLLEMQLSDSARESAKIVSDCAEHMMSLVDDILDFARIETNQLELECIPFDIHEEVVKAFNIHVILAKAKGVQLSAENIELAYPYHIGDPLRFRQVLINLLSNAVKFTSPGGSVKVTVTNESSTPDQINVSVSDTGIGIPAQAKGHVFQSFSQLDTSVGRKYGGSGLGLAISKKLCEAMHGRIWYESEVDSMDDEHIENVLGEGDSKRRSIMEGKKVLVVEDNSVNRRVALKMLTSIGCRVQMASDGAEGVDMFEKDDFDVILMDVQMPIMDGFQATARIRHLELERVRKLNEEIKHQHNNSQEAGEENSTPKDMRRHIRVPIIALTASATYAYQAQCLEKGMDRFLTKPLKKDTLYRVLEDVISGQDATRPTPSIFATSTHDSSLRQRHRRPLEEAAGEHDEPENS